MTNVGVKVSNERVVHRLIGGLIESYNTYVTVVQNMRPLPSFAKAKSMLLLDETHTRKLAVRESFSNSALVTTNINSISSPSNEHRGQQYDNQDRAKAY